MAKEARVDVILQRIEENIGDELDVHPRHIRRYGVNNIFSRTFAYLLGWKTDGKPVKVGATAAGALKIASVGAGFEKYERNPTSDTDGYITISGTDVKTETFSSVMSGFDIWTKDNDIYVQLSADGITWMDKVMLRGSLNEIWSENIAVKAIKLSNVVTDGSANGSYQVIGRI